MAENYHIYFPLIFDFATDFKEAAKFRKIADRLKERFFGDTDIKTNPIAFAKVSYYSYSVFIIP